jgi:hypothetical protein
MRDLLPSLAIVALLTAAVTLGCIFASLLP